MPASFEIKKAELKDATQIADIWNYFVLHSTATVGETLYNKNSVSALLKSCLDKNYAAYCAFEHDNLVGFALYKNFRSASGYRFSMEHSLYISPKNMGKGIGIRLYDKLEEHARAQNIHALIGVITYENKSSIDFHKARGFTIEGVWKEAAFKFNRWLDIAYMQKILN